MVFFSKLKKLILQTDFFYSNCMLRYDADLQYKTFTGGIVSLAIIITIVVGFANMILSTLDLSSITTSTQIIKNKDPAVSTIKISPETSFRFALQIWHLNLSDTKRYFDISFQHWYWENGHRLSQTDIILEKCTKQHFINYPEVTESFEKLRVGNWLCPSLNMTMQLYGKYSSQKYSQYVAIVSACDNNTKIDQPCASPQEIKAYMDKNADFIYFTVYFTNTQINPDKKHYKQYYIQDSSYAIFGRNIGSQSFIYFTDYTVSTDYSIWPFTNNIQDKGVIVQNLAVNHPYQTSNHSVFVYFAFVKGSNSIVYKRQVQKLSAVFSFMGGMIGALSAVFFFIKIYTSVSYQFSIAFQLFKPTSNHNQGEQPQEHISFNFFNFIRYYFYVFLQKIGINCEQPTILKYAKECRSEILKQLDVKALLKRIIFIQHCLNYMIEDYQLDALQIEKPTKPSQIKLIRQKFQSVIENDPNFSMSPSQFHSEFKEEQVEEQSVNTPSDIALMLRQPNRLRKILGFRLENINVGNKIEVRSNEQNKGELQDVIVQNEVKKNKQKNADKNMQGQQKKQNVGRKSKIQNEYEITKRRTIYLNSLKKHADQGNQMSNKIWKHLNKVYEKKIQKRQT